MNSVVTHTATATRPLLIGLTGPAGAGKDTVAAYLEANYAFAAIALADPIGDMLGALLQHVDVDGAWMVERALKEERLPIIGKSYRELAQTLGTEWGRQLDPELWLRIAEYRINQRLAAGDNVVLTDVRFPNEAAWLARAGGHLVRLVREPLALPAVRTHESEQHHAHLEAGFQIRNTSTQSWLYDQIDELMGTLRIAPA